MTERDSEFLTDDEAAAVWRRAAELQAQAAAHARLPDDGDGRDPADGSGDGYAVEHVRAAGAAAGMDREFLEAALSDVRAARTIPSPKGQHRLARWFFGELSDVVEVRRVIAAAPSEGLFAMQETFPHEPYRLALADQRGDPLEGGVLIFDIQGIGSVNPTGLANQVGMSAVRRVFVSLRAVDGATPSCEVTLRCPTSWGHNLGLGFGIAAAGIGGFVGTGLGIVAAAVLEVLGVLGAIAGPAAAAVAVSGALIGAAFGRGGYRKLAAFGLRRALEGLDAMLGAVSARARGVWGAPSVERDRPRPPLVEGDAPRGRPVDT